jgi:hypothetical protein
VTYDLKRHVYSHLKVLPKAFSMMMNKSTFPLYKIIHLTPHLIQMILSDKYIIVNLENMMVKEDTELDLYYHNNSQKGSLQVASRKKTGSDLSYSFSCLHDVRHKPQRSILNVWAYSSAPSSHPEC